MWLMRLVETNLLPDWLVRLAIRTSLTISTRRRYRPDLETRDATRRALIEKFRRSPIAIHTAAANEQHYEVPTAFFRLVLGKWLKYSCCFWPEGVSTLDEAEEAMLRLSCERARIEDGMQILELGCGWGSFCLWVAQHYPNCRIVAVSNSRTQGAYIEAQCQERGFGNVEVVTANVADFETDRRFDRVVSIEMFEHMKNYERLMAKIASFLKPSGLLFVHIFSHREFAFEFEAVDGGNWMAQTFFAGGTMPSDDLLLYFQRDLHIIDHWRVGGLNYTQTLRAWLNRLDRREAAIRRIMADVYGPEQETRWLVNWRLFFIVCEETFRLGAGREFFVSHYLFRKGKALGKV
jgi:cyclopropane-fatty-acyl-phospholipid synthase